MKAPRTKDISTKVWAVASIAVVLVALVVAVSSAAWASPFSAGSTGGTDGTGGTGPQPEETAGLHFLDSLDLPPQLISLTSIGDSETLRIYAEGLGQDQTDTVQALISHNPQVTRIQNVRCIGEFEGAFSPADAVELESGAGSAFTCFQNSPATGSPGAVIEFDLVRVGFGADSLGIETGGAFGSAFFQSGAATAPKPPSSVDVLNLAAPTPTSPPPSTGGGGGGGFTPQPTPTPTPVLTLPTAPTDIEAESGDQVAIIRWEPPEDEGSSPVTSYTAGIEGTQKIQILPATARSAIFTGLENGVPVRLRVRASSAAGDGEYSQSVEIVPAGVPGAPLSVDAHLLSDGATIVVEWQPPDSDNGAPIESYTVESTETPMTPVTVDGDSLSTTLENLDPGDYAFTVKATNSTGSSEASAPSTLAQVPNASVSGAPSSPSGGVPSSLRTGEVNLSEQGMESVSQGVGESGQVLDEPVALEKADDSIFLRLPVELTESGIASGIGLAVEAEGLMLDFEQGDGTFEIASSESVTVRGSGRLSELNGRLVVSVEQLSLIYAPEIETEPSSSGKSIDFKVELNDLPAVGGLVTVRLSSIDELADFTSHSPVETLSNGDLSIVDETGDIALLVHVSLQEVVEALFGDNTVTFEIDPAWLAAHEELGDDIVIFKVTDAGIVHFKNADCETEPSGAALCEATFDGTAAGFSSFGLVAMARQLAPTVNPETSDEPTATVAPADPTAGATVTASPTVETSDGPTPSPSPVPETLPTPLPLPSPVAGDVGGQGGGASPVVVALVALAIGGVIMGGFFVLRYRQSKTLVVIGVLAVASAQLAINSDTSASMSQAPATASVNTVSARLDPAVLESMQAGSYRRFIGQAPLSPVVNNAKSNPLVELGVEVIDGKVLVSGATDAPEDLRAELETLGMIAPSVSGNSVSGRLPVESLTALERIQTDAFFQIEQPATNSGDVLSGGDSSHRADVARELYGVDGTGVVVGVISDSFNCLGQYSKDVSDGELPPDIIVLEEVSSCAGTIDEGRAMMQIIHDLAPGAQIMFHTGFNGSANMAQGIIELADAGADVIVDDVSYMNQPFFQNGVIGEAVNTVSARGVTYVSSAGNLANQTYSTNFNLGDYVLRDSLPSAIGAPRFLGGYPHKFGSGGDPAKRWSQGFSIEPGASLTIYFQWDDTFLTDNGIGAATEMDLYILDETASIVLAGSTSLSLGNDPFEALTVINVGTTQFDGRLAFLLGGGPPPPYFKYIFTTNGSPTYDYVNVGSSVTDEWGTIFGHPNASGALAVGAAEFNHAPDIEDPSRTVVERFSSWGGVHIRRDASGTPITPKLYQKPDVVGADGVATSTTLDHFFGTSAAAPHVAAIAALMLESNPDMAPEEIRHALRSSAIDMEDQGVDDLSGFGYVDAPNALSGTLLSGWTQLNYSTNDIYRHKPTGLIYLAVTETDGVAGNRVVALDPFSLEEVWSFDTPFIPQRVAVSDDQSKVYVSEFETEGIYCVDVSTNSIDQTVNPSAQNGNWIYDLDVRPGHPEMIVAMKSDPDGELLLFDSGILDSIDVNEAKIEFFDESTLFRGSARIAVTDTSLTIVGTASGGRSPGDVEYAGEYFFANDGTVSDLETLNYAGEFYVKENVGALVIATRDGGRVHYIGRTNGDRKDEFDYSTLMTFDVYPGITYAVESGIHRGSMVLPDYYKLFEADDVERWGRHGFVYRLQSGGIVFATTELFDDLLIGRGAITAAGIDSGVAASHGLVTARAVPIIGDPMTAVADESGEFELGMLSGLYRLEASAPGYLSAISEDIRINDADLYMESVELIPGDTDADDSIGSTDATNVALAFGQSLQDGLDSFGNAVDFNGDGLVTALDASLMVTNLGVTGPVSWAIDDDPEIVSTPTPEPTATPTATPDPDLPDPVQLVPTGSGVSFSTPLFDWYDEVVNGVATYHFQVDDQPDFSSPEIDVITAVSEYQVQADEALTSGNYYVRGKTFDDGTPGEWSRTYNRLIIDEAHEFIFFATAESDGSDASIKRYNRITRVTETIVSDAIAPRDVAVSHTLGKVYWSDMGDWTIKRANFDGTGVETVISGSLVDYFEIDDDAGLLFRHTPDYLVRSDLSGDDQSIVVDAIGPIAGLTLDPEQQHIYISLPGAGVLRSGYDGTGQTLHLVNPVWPQTEIYFDTTIDRIFFYRPDQAVRSILSANPDGSQQKIVISTGNSAPLKFGLSVDESSMQLVWSAPSGIRSVNREGVHVAGASSLIDHYDAPIYGLAFGPGVGP